MNHPALAQKMQLISVELYKCIGVQNPHRIIFTNILLFMFLLYKRIDFHP